MALHGIKNEMTAFIILHRFSTIEHADEILVFEEGKIVGRGTYMTFLETLDAFQNLTSEKQKKFKCL